MKKLLSLILVCVLLLGLAACASSGSNAQNAATGTTAAAAGFMVGYGKANITPDTSVPMGGYGRSEARMSTGILSYLYATCIAISDVDGNTILLFGLDACNSAEAGKFITNIAEATGVPSDNIVISASHTHSSCDYSCTDVPGVSQALQKLKEGLISAATDAMEDRKVATMYTATVETAGLNFVRHYKMNDGTFCGDNFGSTESGYAGHATDADPIMQLVKFVREGDNDIILTNFQTHPHRTGGSSKYDLSADIVGEYRTAMEEALGCEVIYFSGAGGNINPTSRIAEENVTSDFREQGKALAKYAQSAVYTESATGKVQASTLYYTADVNHANDSVADICRELRARWDAGEITTAELIEIGASYGLELHSPYHAGAISSRASLDKTYSFNIWAFSFGDVGFVGAPYEMFDTNGVYIKENSPFDVTIIGTIANQTVGYIPSAYTFEYGSYETDTTKFTPGTGEALAEQYVSMLETLYSNR